LYSGGGTAATGSVSAPGDYDDGGFGAMIGRGNRSTRRKPAPVLLRPPQTSHAARTRTRVASVGSQRLTALATAQPSRLFIALVLLKIATCGSDVQLDWLPFAIYEH
jgi:hypothetical protein